MSSEDLRVAGLGEGVSSDAGGEPVGEGFGGDLGVTVEVVSFEEPQAGACRDVGQQHVDGVAVFAFAVAEDQVRELVQDELLAVQGGVAAGVEHEVFGVGDEPDRADAVVGVEVCEFDNTEPAVSPVLDGVEEVVEGEGAAEL